jgi:uncharacterized protein YndB with AHSA1/START domain
VSGQRLLTTMFAVVSALAPGARGLHAADQLDPSLETLRPFLGQWEVTTEWFDGGLLWAQMTNTVEAGGREIHSRVLAAEGDGEPYERYRIRYFVDENGALQERLASYRGIDLQRPISAESTPDGVVLSILYPPGTLADIGIRKELSAVASTLHWRDYFQNEASGEWERVIDADWIRTAPPDPASRSMPIDDSLFDAGGPGVRSITLERIMNAPPQQVWDAWTREPDWKAAYGPDRAELRANIELAPGGKYEWLFDGVLGCNGCQVLSYLPPRMLSFTWNAPVSQPQSRVRRTWVVIEIEAESDGKSRVRATQLGFGEGPHWDETKDYFEKGWTYVLDQMAGNFSNQTSR